jgi:YVTN family beta-propeller protein
MSGPTACTTTAQGQRRGSAIALTSDGDTLISVNRDANSVTVTSVTYPAASPNNAALTEVAELNVGSEPWQVIIDGCDNTAYVVLRQDQKVVEITNLKTTPTVGRSVAVGSEPISLALTPNNTQLYVSNWVDGNLSVIDPFTMTVTSTIDLNATLAATGFLGPDVLFTPRPGLAHPRGIAITNNGDTSDNDETVYVTEWFAVRTGPEQAQPHGPAAGQAFSADTNRMGLLYEVPVTTGTPTFITLPPVTNTGFKDARGNVTGCFPNQVASVTIENEGTNAVPQYYAYVSSTCASPAGPVGVFQYGQCQINANCTAFGVTSTCDLMNGVCTASCATDAQCGAGSAAGACNIATGECAPLTANVKTTTHPALTIVNLTGTTPSAVTTNLDAPFTNTAPSTARTQSGTASTRVPLLPTDIDFEPGFAYVTAEGTDALFRLSESAGNITAVGSGASLNFIDLQTTTATIAGTTRLPIGVAINQSAAQPVAFVANDGTRSVVAVNLSVQAVSTNAAGEIQTSAEPAANSTAASVLNGKRFFNTGLDRWSLNGAGWASCGACHIDGLSDGVTWYFDRGPRQTTSLDGTFGKNAPSGTVDQRILNWTAGNDEIADLDTYVRSISGGVGAIVSASSSPPAVTDRVNLISSTPPQMALEGSSAATALATNVAGVSTNWQDLTSYIAQIRSPRAVTPSLLNGANVSAGAAVFASASCNGCHSGEKWTISTVFYPPGNTPNDAFGSTASTSLGQTSWLAGALTAGFPASLFPSTTSGEQTMRAGPPTGFEQLQCILRPVGTIAAPNTSAPFPTIPSGVSPVGVSVVELRQDMGTPLSAAGGAQGSGTQGASDVGAGYNIPSLLGLQVGAPFFHAGNARTLEEVFTGATGPDGSGNYTNSIFAKHHEALSALFTPSTRTVPQLVAFLLSIDGTTTPMSIPAASAVGGDICHDP